MKDLLKTILIEQPLDIPIVIKASVLDEKLILDLFLKESNNLIFYPLLLLIMTVNYT